MKKLLVFIMSLCALGCEKPDDRGTLDAPCRPDGSCNEGLICYMRVGPLPERRVAHLCALKSTFDIRDRPDDGIRTEIIRQR